MKDRALSLPGETCPAWGPEVDLDPYKQRGTEQDEEFVHWPLTVLKVMFY